MALDGSKVNLDYLKKYFTVNIESSKMKLYYVYHVKKCVP